MENFNMKKSLGQNFLKNRDIVYNIVDSVSPIDNNLVIEVGPGAGAMTEVLAQKFDNVLAYEIDWELKPILDKLSSNYKNVKVIFDDFMERDILDDIKEYNVKNIYFIANLPYYITTPIINKLIDLDLGIKNIVVMVQKEVADRFCAKIGSKSYGSLTVFLNYYYDINKVCNVSKNNFYPVPKVDSAVVNMSLKDKKLDISDLDKFFKLVRDSFKYKRKTIRNNLKSYDLNIVEEVLKRYSLDLSVRAEAVPLEVFVDIANELNK